MLDTTPAMIAICASIFISWLLTQIAQVWLPYQLLSAPVAVHPSFFVASQREALSVKNVFEVLPPTLEELQETICREVPSGLGVPGFQPGMSKTEVMGMLGVPNVSSSGYWPNTHAIAYELIPDRVSLGFLFDKKSERIRQTEASFTPDVDSQVMLFTFNGMLGCKINDRIKLGLEQVLLRQSRRYSFTLGSLEGMISRDKRDRIYIGIWEHDLH